MRYIWGLSLHLWWMKTAGDCRRWLTKLLIIILRAVKELLNWEYMSVLYFRIHLICRCSLVTQRKGSLCSTRILSFSSQARGPGGRAASSGAAGLCCHISLFLWVRAVLTFGGASVYSVVCIPLENVGTTLHLISRGWIFSNSDTVRLTHNQVASLAG